MGAEEVVDTAPTSSFEFKDNAVQGILTESVSSIDESRNNEKSRAVHGTTSTSTSTSTRYNNDLSELTENLILCSAFAVTPSVLKARNISCIINAAPELSDTPLGDTEVIYHKVPVMDSGSCRIFSYFDEAADLIHEVSTSGGNCLVYCLAGVSRSASICLAYLMKHQNMTLRKAYDYVKSKRSKIRPNCGFFKQLIEYEENLYGKNSVKMVYNDFVRMEIPDVYDCEYRLVSDFRKRLGQTERHKENCTIN